jgi:uncharacterized cupin superfamily protein
MAFSKITEAQLAPDDGGLAPADDGWFVANVADACATHYNRFGHTCSFEGSQRFPELGFNVHVLEPGQASGIYHRENQQEDFLVLCGEVLAIVEDEERTLHTGDLLHCPAGTAHVLIGAGGRPSTVVMVGARRPDAAYFYPESAVAARYHASVEHETDSGKVAYAGVGPAAPRPLGGVPW